jgi:hypothetical protein
MCDSEMPPTQKAAMSLGTAIVAFFGGGALYSLIGFQAPTWFKDAIAAPFQLLS